MRITGLLSWMLERHAIYLRRAADQPKPWTDDPILQQYRFCNVFRELDRVTIWIRENWREPYAEHRNLWFAMVIARYINWPPTLRKVGFPKRWNPQRFIETLELQKALGKQVYTGAYILRADRSGGAKSVYVAEILDNLFARRPFPQFYTLQNAHSWLMETSGVGGFMAYEIVTDLRHTRYLRDASDIMTWANPGPGAARGLNRVHGRPVKAPVKFEQAVEEMRALLKHVTPQWHKKHPGVALEMRDIEHSLCEFDKYERVRLGEGRPKSKYSGES